MMIRATQALTLLLLLGAPSLPAQLPVARIDSLVEARRQALRIPGIALAIVHPLEVLHERGFGIRVPDGDPVAPSTPFPIRAYSAPITGTIAYRLADRGLLALDAPLGEPGSAWDVELGTVTPRHLLLHRSGLVAGATAPDAPPPLDLAAAAESLQRTRPATPVGATFGYADANYLLLARLLEERTGQPYPVLVQHEIRDPLGLPPPEDPEAAGTVHLSARDLGRLVRAHLNLGTLGDTTLLTVTSVAEMTRFDSGARYAAGWGWRTIPGRDAVGYSGVLEGAQAEVVMLPRDGLGVVLLANGGSVRQWRGVQRLAEDVALVALGEPPRPGATESWPPGVLLGLLGALLLGGGVALAIRRRRGSRAIPTRS